MQSDPKLVYSNVESYVFRRLLNYLRSIMLLVIASPLKINIKIIGKIIFFEILRVFNIENVQLISSEKLVSH